VTIVAELGELSRFGQARQLMAYSGTVAREHSSGESCKRGGITKTGKVHLRRIAVEAAWAYRHAPAVTACLGKRQEGVREEVKEIAWKAQHRLHGRYPDRSRLCGIDPRISELSVVKLSRPQPGLPPQEERMKNRCR
jgi:transposase